MKIIYKFIFINKLPISSSSYPPFKGGCLKSGV